MLSKCCIHRLERASILKLMRGLICNESYTWACLEKMWHCFTQQAGHSTSEFCAFCFLSFHFVCSGARCGSSEVLNSFPWENLRVEVRFVGWKAYAAKQTILKEHAQVSWLQSQTRMSNKSMRTCLPLLSECIHCFLSCYE